MSAQGLCPVCGSGLEGMVENPHRRDGNWYNCHNCGCYFCSGTALALLESEPEIIKAALSHMIWRKRSSGQDVSIGREELIQACKMEFPDPEEQMDNLILFLGNEQYAEISKQFELQFQDLRAKLGSFTSHDAKYVVLEAFERGLLKGTPAQSMAIASLSFDGWRYFRELERGHTKSTHAFMAMPFGHPELTAFVDTCFRPAVAETGFTLKRLDDAPEAGVIDNRMRVEIRQSKFVIADLTNENRGAYWEAGFAEGLGKPVIYTCEKSYFDANKTHFDTNHCTTVIWDAAEPEKAAEELKATIRNTFPIEAKMPKESAG